MNVIIPIGGVGQRFRDEGYLMPKPLINVLGKSMIYRVIDTLDIDSKDTIYIVYHNHLKEFNFEDLIKFYFPKKNIQFIPLDYMTKGAAETVLNCLNTLDNKKLNENFLLLDCDTFYEDNIIESFKQSPNKNLIHYHTDTNPDPIFSYIKTNHKGQVTEIKEKIKISNKANTGAYGFESGYLLKKYCNQVLDLNSELYISHVYNEMLKDNIEIYGKEIFEFNCVGTPLQLQIYCNQNKHKSEKLRICFDFDNTLVSYPTIPGDYYSVKPITRNINFVKLLKELGHTIIIYTARRMRTHGGNVGAVMADISKVTFDTLDKFDIPYDEVYFGKPYANFYVDDLAVNPSLSLDKTLGIFNTNTTPRDFNKVEFQGNKVIKYTSNKGEVFWYQNIPEEIKQYFPKVYKAQDNKLVLENVKGVNYSYLYTNKSLTLEDLDTLMMSLIDVHSIKNPSKSNIYANYVEKLTQRYYDHKMLYKKHYSSKEIFDTLVEKLTNYENKSLGYSSTIHGDPVFTNILKTETGIKFIDMRGKLGDELTLEGDMYYDFAKIYQSIIGYDFILNDIEIDNIYINKFKTHFESKFIDPDSIKHIKVITASLLFSLLPLHSYCPDKFTNYFKLIKSLL
jgi:capsule biosynthesis phosphatase